MAKGNTNIIINNQNIADGNVAGALTHITNGSVRFKQGLPKGVTDKEIRLAFNFRNAFKSGNPESEINSFFASLEAQFKSIKYASDSILFWVVRKKYSYRELAQFGSSGGLFSTGLLPRLFPDLSRQVTQWWNQGSSGLLNNPIVQATSSTLGISTSISIGSSTDLKSYFDVTSDSIGVIANTKYMQLDSTLPLIDITQERYGVPIPFSASSENKISPTTRNIMYNLSKFNTALMRRNLIPVAYGNTTVTANLAVDATLPHGVNLINDLPTFVKLNTGIKALVAGLRGAIADIRVFRYVSYLGNIGNKSGFNYRDNRPAMSSDKDFVVLSGEEQAAGIVDEINEMAKLSQAQAAVQKAAQSDLINKFFAGRPSVILPNNTYTVSPTNGMATGPASTTPLDNQPNTAQNISTFSANNDGNTEVDVNVSASYLGQTATGIPNDSDILGYTIPLDMSTGRIQTVDGQPVGAYNRPAIVTFTDTKTNTEYKLLVVGNDVGGKWGIDPKTNQRSSNIREWGEFGTNTYRALQNMGHPVDIKYNDLQNMTQTTASFQFLEGRVETVEQYRQLQSQLQDQGRIGTYQTTNTTSRPNVQQVSAAAQTIIDSRNRDASQAEIAAATRTVRGQTVVDVMALYDNASPGAAPAQGSASAPAVSQMARDPQGNPVFEPEEGLPSWDGETGTTTSADADFIALPGEVGTSNQLAASNNNANAFAPTPLTLAGTPSDTAQTGINTVAAPGFNNLQLTQNDQTQSNQSFLSEMTSLLDGLGAGKYSNRQKSDIYTFFINVEGTYQKVDYLLKRISTGLNPCKSIIQRLSTKATTALSNAIDTSSPATAASQLSLLGIPSQFAELGGSLLQGMFSGEDTNKIITGAISDQFVNFTDPLLENPWVQGYDSAVGGLNELGGLIGGAEAAGGLLPTSSELFEALDPGLFLEELKIPSILPSVDIGSIKDLLSLAASVATSGPPTSLTGLIKMQEQLYSIICNFELPLITFPDLEALLKMKFKDVKQMVIDMITKFVDRILDQFNILKLLKNLKKTFKQLLEEIKQKIIEQLFSCEKYKKADKSGKPSVGG